MNKANDALAFFLVATLGLACSDSGLKSQNTGTGGQSSPTASGGSLGAGGVAGAGGAGGSASGGATGAGGATCLSTLCIGTACPGGYVPNPEPCGCPICPVPDAGAVKDSAADTACIQPPCAAIKCAPGYQTITPPCGCPTCVPIDGGSSDAIVCPFMACPAIGCANGTLPNPDPCGCPICAPADAAADKPQAACTRLDECACRSADGCAPIAEPCYCPFPQCGSEGACICGGGKYLGCAPTDVATCSGAKAQLATLCPTLKGPTFDGLCGGTNSACVTKCLGEVTSCSDVFCTFCETCGCASDRFTQCLGKCTSAMAQN
jgi:hypothetical protein